MDTAKPIQAMVATPANPQSREGSPLARAMVTCPSYWLTLQTRRPSS
jgi:hypothetical protein